MIRINEKRMRRMGRVRAEQTDGWGGVESTEKKRLQRREKGGGGRNKGFVDEREKG